jgi:hypothetical protein
MRVEYNINEVQDTSYPLVQYGLLDVYSPVAPGLTGSGQPNSIVDRGLGVCILAHPTEYLWRVQF